jgi:hypothetical protein
MDEGETGVRGGTGDATELLRGPSISTLESDCGSVGLTVVSKNDVAWSIEHDCDAS